MVTLLDLGNAEVPRGALVLVHGPPTALFPCRYVGEHPI